MRAASMCRAFWGSGLLMWCVLLGAGCQGCVDVSDPQPWELVEPPPAVVEPVDELRPLLVAVERVDFGEVGLGSSRTEQIELRNEGGAALTVYGLEVEGRFALEGGSVWEERVILPGEGVKVGVTYRSTDRVGSIGALVVRSDDGRRPAHRVVLTANVALPCMMVTPERLDLGGVPQGESARGVFRIESCSDELVTTFSLDVEHANRAGHAFGVLDEGRYRRVRLMPRDALVVEVEFKPQSVSGEYRGSFRFDSDSDGGRQHEVEVVAQVVEPGCPSAVIEARHESRSTVVANPRGTYRGEPLDVVSLSAERSRGSDGRGVSRVEWSLVRSPSDSGATFLGQSTQRAPQLFLDLAGEYTVELHVWDERGVRSCEPARLELIARPEQDLHVQLVWDTPNDPDQFDEQGSDVDIHLLRDGGIWNVSPWDCNWQNMRPDWGVRGDTSDDPSLDRDDMSGWGPENINLNNPERGWRYHVGVHYFSDQGYGVSFATVRVYTRGELLYEARRKRITDQQLWHPVTIDWPSRAVTAYDTVYATFPAGVFRP